MKKKSILLVLSIMAVAVFCVHGAAYAGASGTSGDEFIYPDKKATGTEVKGTASLYFTPPLPYPNQTKDVPVYWFLRVVEGKNVYGFDGEISGNLGSDPPAYWPGGPPPPAPGSLQANLIENLNATYPTFLQTLGFPAGSTFVLKNFSNLVATTDGAWLGFKFVLAVQVPAK
ncbi:MAG: hypothetical protein ACLQVJ_10065 [Syntrophobacteraceae bacterium]